jgi:hypothetical protein
LLALGNDHFADEKNCHVLFAGCGTQHGKEAMSSSDNGSKWKISVKVGSRCHLKVEIEF